MGLFIQLKQAKDVDITTVGVLAQKRALALESIPQAFTLILTSTLVDAILSSAGLLECKSRLPEDTTQRVALLQEVTTKLQQVKMTPQISESLREAFELITLDTGDLKSLAQLPLQRSILGIIPSPSYTAPARQRLFVSGDTFDAFFEQVKISISSFFTPEAIETRQKMQLRDWYVALLVFRLPNIYTCFEVRRSLEGSSVKSYQGLPDIRQAVEKDEYTIQGEIPAIVQRKIVQQKTVCVYALNQNQIVAKEYVSSSSSLQSAPDYDILEANRLTKKLLQEKPVHALYVKPKQGTLLLIDTYEEQEVQVKKVPHPRQEKLGITQELKDQFPELEKAIHADNHSTVQHLVHAMKEQLSRLLHR